MQLPITWKQVSAFRLMRHHLLRRAPLNDLVPVAGGMAGVQAQLFSAAQIGLWARVRELKLSDIEGALTERQLVRAACMRQTLFLVPSKEVAVFVRGSARRAAKEVRWTLGKGVPEHVIDKAIDTALSVLDEPLTRTEIAERLTRKLGVQRHEVQGGGWGSRRKLAAVPVGDLIFPVVDLLHLVASRGVVCYGPYRGSEPTFVRADAWIPDWKDIPAEQAEELLLRTYLQAFGPSTAADFSMWSGMTLGEASEIWKREQSALASVTVEGWQAEILRDDLNTLSQAGLEQSLVRLLPYFDTFLLGHKERDHLAAPEHRPLIYRPQGWIAPVVLVDGRAAAVWEYKQEGDRLQVKVRKFSSISRRIAAEIKHEARDLGRLLGTSNVEVQID